MKKGVFVIPLILSFVLSGCFLTDLFNSKKDNNDQQQHQDEKDDQQHGGDDQKPEKEFIPEKYETNGVSISLYKIVVPEFFNSTVDYASKELQKYINEATGTTLSIVNDAENESDYEIILGECNRNEVKDINFASLGDESYIIKNVGNDLIISANKKRGLLYGVYSFLEALGYRFFTPDCERIPSANDVFVPKNINLNWTPAVDLRDVMFKCAWDAEFAVKLKVNHDFQRSLLKNTTKYGGTTGYIGGGRYLVHTFKYLLPYNTYYSTHRDWFASNVGTTYTDAEHLQPCFSNYDSIDVVMANIDSLIESDPNSNIISLSQNDGGKFCQCSQCVAAEQIYGKSGVLLRYINRLAQKIKVKYPHIKVDTLAYDWSLEAPLGGVVAEDNVVIRFCTELCPFHDETNKCEKYQKKINYFLDWQECASEFSVWTYPITWSNLYTSWPNYFELKHQNEFYVKHGVRSIYQEGFAEDSCEFAELKAYVLAKSAANPLMSDEEFEYHIRDFLKGYYGEGWKNVRNYIEYAHNAILENISKFGCLSTHAGTDELFDFKWDGESYDMDFVNKMNRCWEKALELSDSESFPHVEKSSLHWIYIELYNTFDNRFLSGTSEEREELKQRNRDLYYNLKKYNAVYIYDDRTINLNVTDFSSSPQTWL